MRLAFIVARYGRGITGGAERLVHGFAHEAVKRDWSVEIWTTCAKSYYTWENELPAGQQEEDGILIRRFPITSWRRDDLGRLNVALEKDHKLPVAEQYQWLAYGPHSQPLYEYVAEHATDFESLIALPYLMSIVNYAAWLAPERTIVWPCLHDEMFAYLEPIRLLLESVRGVIFNSPEEKRLTDRKLGIDCRQTAVTGVGTSLSLAAPKPLSDQPYLLYIGRLEEAKNITVLQEYFTRYVTAGRQVKLLMLGDGSFQPRQHPAIEYLGYVSDKDKADYCASALAICQPSLNESFSLAIMEGWLAGRPALVHHNSPVTQAHVARSKGGLWFRAYGEFAAALDYFLDQPQEAKRMGQNGRRYVLQNFTWPIVVDRFQEALNRWDPLPA